MAVQRTPNLKDELRVIPGQDGLLIDNDVFIICASL
jgi:hypothetical protein